jgi:hypothetical protein
MAWFEKRLWTRRKIEEGRQTLAASLEEMAARGELSGTDWETELADDEPAEGTAIIPPRLRLQSHHWPVVRVDGTDGPPDEHGQLLRFARSEEPEKDQARRLGRSSRVHLQAVRVEQAQEPITERVQSLETSGSMSEHESARMVSPMEGQKIAAAVEASALYRPVHGSGLIEQGQEEVTISCARVSRRSVVMVMLTGNPGPVVVQYVTLHPHAGFTFHLSAPVATPTPFNYLFWPCEREA